MNTSEMRIPAENQSEAMRMKCLMQKIARDECSNLRQFQPRQLLQQVSNGWQACQVHEIRQYLRSSKF
jgi:hypothetical protein